MANSKPRVIWEDKANFYRVVRLARGSFVFQARTKNTWIEPANGTGIPMWAANATLEKLSRRRRRRKVSR